MNRRMPQTAPTHTLAVTQAGKASNENLVVHPPSLLDNKARISANSAIIFTKTLHLIRDALVIAASTAFWTPLRR